MREEVRRRELLVASFGIDTEAATGHAPRAVVEHGREGRRADAELGVERPSLVARVVGACPWP